MASWHRPRPFGPRLFSFSLTSLLQVYWQPAFGCHLASAVSHYDGAKDDDVVLQIRCAMLVSCGTLRTLELIAPLEGSCLMFSQPHRPRSELEKAIWARWSKQGWSLLIFLEGERASTGEIGRFLTGVRLIASRLQLSVVPIRLRGHRSANWSRSEPAEVKIGVPILLEGESHPDLALKLEKLIRNLRQTTETYRHVAITSKV